MVPPRQADPAARRATCAVALLALVALAWGGVPGGTFQFDDEPTILRDPATWDTGALVERLATGIRPLLRLSWFATARVAGAEPAAFLAVNLALHAATVLLVAALARRRAGDLGAFVAGAVFALQPAHAEVVAYVSGRSTGLMALFVLVALLARERAGETAGRGTRWWRAAEVVAFLAAVATKEVALIYPALALAWEATRPGGARPGTRREAAAYAAVVLALLVALALRPRYRELLAYSLGLRDPLSSLVAGLGSIPVMVSLWVRPWALSVEHPPPPAGAAYLAFAAIAAAVLLRRRSPAAAFALSWALLALAPTQSFIARADLVSEKPLYLAWVGPALALGLKMRGQAPRFRFSRQRDGLVAAALLLLAIVAVPACRARVAVWSDPARLWAEAVQRAPASPRAWTNRGIVAMERGDARGAARAFRRALALDPQHAGARASLAHLEVVAGAAIVAGSVEPDPEEMP